MMGNMEMIIDIDGYMEIVFGTSKIRVRPSAFTNDNIYAMTREQLETIIKNAIVAEIEEKGLV